MRGEVGAERRQTNDSQSRLTNVATGLDPVVHVESNTCDTVIMDGRVMPGHDKKMKRAGIFLALTVAALAFAAPALAQACKWANETVTFLAKSPPNAEREPVVAEVEVVKMLSAQPGVEWYFSHLVLARVVSGVKGIEAGREIVVNTRDTLCDQTMSSGAIGRKYFLAGKFVKTENGDEHFSGRWKRDLKSGEMVKDAE